MTWTPTSAWTELENHPGIYYYSGTDATDGVLSASDTAYEYYFLAGDTTHANGVVSYRPEITLGDMGDLDMTADLSFKAYAIQAGDFFADAEAAWNGVVELPAASITAFTAEELNAVNNNTEYPLVDFITRDTNLALDAASKFATTDTAADIADEEYENWAVDFRISFSQDIADTSKVHLFGQYDNWDPNSWYGDDLKQGGFDSLAAGDMVMVVDSMLKMLSMNGTIPYSMIVSDVQNFNCGIVIEEGAFASGIENVTVTLELIMVDDYGHIHVVDTNTYNVSAT